ncbi:tyrosine-type recombinase/integrase [Sphingobacterium sp. SRCM116780]|uniref:tyrosine-type recombinase/integrase n=1 Tax=Sphingobacterium sp. SRCM116780 TaxID=2907623 RepID=UPI001F440BA9|nr:tyrosine-type recombinase/integrase [Sphingobacterium sp. SRCM116780]UIR57468.1 tyrosine-type recombinase/integrase [Sphingobacterium sp. SRCM116780]
MYQKEFERYLQFERRYSKHTLTAYLHEVSLFLTFLEHENLAFEQVTHRDMRHYFALMTEAKKSATTVNRSISALRTYFKYLQREGVMKGNPIQIKALKTPKKLPVVVEKEKLVQLLDHLEGEVNDFESRRDKLVMELLFGTGIRLAELLQIQDRDIDYYNKNILIFGKRSKERLVPINATLIKELQLYLQAKSLNINNTKSSFLIVTKEGKPAYAKLIYRIVHKYLSMVSLQQKRSPHILRHTFATALLDNGADLNAIKELLGHAGLAATQVYTHNSVERLKSIYKQAHPKA